MGKLLKITMALLTIAACYSAQTPSVDKVVGSIEKVGGLINKINAVASKQIPDKKQVPVQGQIENKSARAAEGSGNTVRSQNKNVGQQTRSQQTQVAPKGEMPQEPITKHAKKPSTRQTAKQSKVETLKQGTGKAKKHKARRVSKGKTEANTPKERRAVTNLVRL
jgi:hypothetical protein